ncbi:hypothetical protein SAMN05421788_110265 [Filimonas lacunae]|uniref:Uncharacterized protein n=1 Tax=Filimonas lacunae TaxID=477680 RepID=A0A173MAG1_9BACT|nr:hypothetical protein [Filimonas lacunae]BAV04535.1 hypothetical protein FLA_0527 [Filimonas lacunae]SIT31724.1 hypothetical protein SAMN05421788_110265 [Filimonas lacunae]
MKKVIVLSAVVISSLVFSHSANAQVRFNVSINVGAQPTWVNNSNTRDADYYYIPDADCYYSVNEKMYVYRDGANWRKAPQLPGRFKNFDFRNKRVIGIKGQEAPYMHHAENRNAYNNANEKFNHQQPDRQPQRGNDNKGNNGFGRRS